MKADGSTAGGCWIYSGIYKDGVNQAARRRPGQEQDWVAAEWGWAWPMDRRTLYNRASADPEGRPWSERKAYVWWDEAEQQWTGHDVPDFELKKPRRTGRRRAPVVRRASPVTTRSSCRPTARAGCTRRAACWTGRCRRTTSRTSRR
jgi:formate dehydrogenase major subunit